MIDIRENVNAVRECIGYYIEKYTMFNKIKFVNVPSAFDIETYTTWSYDQDGNRSQGFTNMYIWQFGIGLFPDDYEVIIGRTWEDFNVLLNIIAESKQNSTNLHCWVHNLGYEFQFIKDRVKWRINRNGDADIFAIDSRKPIKAKTETGIVFHDSYIQSNKSLEEVGKSLMKYKVEKAVGNLDYNVPRNSKTELTMDEMIYCINDVLVLLAYEREEMESYGNAEKIIMTNTGRVRDAVEDCMKFDQQWKKVGRPESALDIHEYNILCEAFQGGFTHSNPFMSLETYKDVTSIDFTSSYPTVLLSEKFPSGEKSYFDNDIDPQNITSPHWVGCIMFKNIRRDVNAPDGILSLSKCTCKNELTVNGRILSAEELVTYCTEIDYKNICDFYNFDSATIGARIEYSKSEYLPLNFRILALKMYTIKTQYKGVEDKAEEYMKAKNMFNSLYGMAVTAWIQDNNLYDPDSHEWFVRHNDELKRDELLEKKSNSFKRFLKYEDGVWCTAYARRNLFLGIKEFGMDYLYSDTDSIKCLNVELHMDYIRKYNREISRKLKMACSHAKTDTQARWMQNMLAPKDVKGKRHPLGVWDIEETYKEFKSLRAKAYLVRHEDGSLLLTLAGCNKKGGTEFFESRKHPFDDFNLEVCIPEEYTRKLVPQYNDIEGEWEVTDEQGNTEIVHECSWVSLKPVSYEMNADMGSAYVALIDNLKKIRYRRDI